MVRRSRPCSGWRVRIPADSGQAVTTWCACGAVEPGSGSGALERVSTGCFLQFPTLKEFLPDSVPAERMRKKELVRSTEYRLFLYIDIYAPDFGDQADKYP